MRSSFRSRIFWTVVGFALGYGFALANAALKIWPFQNDATLHWVRWLGKETLRWTIIAVILVVVVQLLNLALGALRDMLDSRREQ